MKSKNSIALVENFPWGVLVLIIFKLWYKRTPLTGKHRHNAHRYSPGRRIASCAAHVASGVRHTLPAAHIRHTFPAAHAARGEFPVLPGCPPPPPLKGSCSCWAALLLAAQHEPGRSVAAGRHGCLQRSMRQGPHACGHMRSEANDEGWHRALAL